MKLVQLAHEYNGDVIGRIKRDGTFSPYELNLNYFDAVNKPNSNEPIEIQIAKFILSQAITFSLVAIPGLYIHSLLGSRNYTEGVKHTGRTRTINREQLVLVLLEQDLADIHSLCAQVLKKLHQLLTIRESCSAFHPSAEQQILDIGTEFFVVHRINHSTATELIALHNVTHALRTTYVSRLKIKNMY